MKVSRAWLQKYFDTPLPPAAQLADALTFHAFEIEEVVGDMLDIKVLPNRSADCLSHRGIAAELSAILSIPLKADPLREPLPVWPVNEELSVRTDPSFVLRHTGALIAGVRVGPSPAWLREALESVGQRSINNIVDATNYCMFDIGQPAHAFDTAVSGTKIEIRRAMTGEKVTVLTGETFTLTDKIFVFGNALTDEALDIAGIKGGINSGVSEATTDLFVSVGNYDGTTTRRTAQALKLFTDASLRFQNRPSPELTAYGMRDLLSRIVEVAGGTVISVVDTYNTRPELHQVSVSRDDIEHRLGSEYSKLEIESVFMRLQLPFTTQGNSYVVTPPWERTDLVIQEDLIEEVGRIVGYDRVEPKVLGGEDAVDQRIYRGIERLKDLIVGAGYSEVSTQSFTKKGTVQLANPLDVGNPFLRQSLSQNMKKALEQGTRLQPLILPPKEKLKLFEIGNVFGATEERLSLALTEPLPELDVVLGQRATVTDGIVEYDLSKFDLETYGEGYKLGRVILGSFVQYSLYPFVLRDIALWVQDGTASDTVAPVLANAAGTLLVRHDLFDTFSKAGRTSYAFRLVFQSMERTLTDDEVNAVMQKVTAAAVQKGWEVR